MFSQDPQSHLIEHCLHRSLPQELQVMALSSSNVRSHELHFTVEMGIRFAVLEAVLGIINRERDKVLIGGEESF